MGAAVQHAKLQQHQDHENREKDHRHCRGIADAQIDEAFLIDGP